MTPFQKQTDELFIYIKELKKELSYLKERLEKGIPEIAHQFEIKGRVLELERNILNLSNLLKG